MKKSGAFWGIILIFAGLIWILDSTNLISMDIWGAVSTLWPIFIIAAGFTFFFKRESHLPRIILWFFVFAIIGGYGVYLGYQDDSSTSKSKTFDINSEIKKASMTVNIGGANFDISSTSDKLADIITDVKDIQSDFNEGSTSKIVYFQKNPIKFEFGNRKKFTAHLNETIPWDIELNTGAVNGKLDFKGFPLESCRINTGACDLKIIAGNKQEDSSIEINGGVVNLSLSVPKDVGVKIHSSSGITKVNGSKSIAKNGETYTSDNYDTALYKLNLNVASGVCNVSINR